MNTSSSNKELPLGRHGAFQKLFPAHAISLIGSDIVRAGLDHESKERRFMTAEGAWKSAPATERKLLITHLMSAMNSCRRFFRIALLLTFLLAICAPSELSAKTKRSKTNRSKSARVALKFAPATPFSTVVIDAGHGGFDRGGTRQNIIPEKDVALDVAQRLEKSLRKSGLKTVMTRSDDRFVTLDQRVAIANAHRDAIFMCIHFNAAFRPSARGIETFYATPSEVKLARRIQRNLAATTTGDNRGVKRASFHVLRKTKIRAVLAECGFLTNPQDVALARNSGYRQRLADQISRAIVEERNSLL